MNTLLLHPTDVLFFRDGRPMSGSLSGHGAAWPLPTVISAAFHAALHRADLEAVKPHWHVPVEGNKRESSRKFGSLFTAGPFPVQHTGAGNNWYFPRPLEAGGTDDTRPAYAPLASSSEPKAPSSLPACLRYPVVSTGREGKATPAPWWSGAAIEASLRNHALPDGAARHFQQDDSIAETEFSYGIGIDPETGTQDGKSFYSASYLRLRDSWTLGAFARAQEGGGRNASPSRDLIAELFPNSGTHTPIVAGGQQRICTVQRECLAQLPLPKGMTEGFSHSGDSYRVKWVLLAPAIFPHIKRDSEKQIAEHSGGWIPNWVSPDDGKVQLLDGPGKNAADRRGLQSGKPLQAQLVAAIVGKPVFVTGYALPQEAAERPKGGAKSTHLAVPAGSVYYFECTGAEEARKLAAALNWHGAGDATTIRSRRSTLMGEKGFGLGVCGTWEFHQ